MNTAPIDDAARERFLTSFLMVQPSVRSCVQALVTDQLLSLESHAEYRATGGPAP